MKIYCAKCNHVFNIETPSDQDSVSCPKCGALVQCPKDKLGPGTVIGDFVIEHSISKGGMGEVFQAKQISLDRPVALKVLQDKFLDDKEYVDSLFREARAAGKISHPNIVQAYAVGEEDGIFYFAMELIRGETLKQILKREKKLEFTKAAKIIREIAGALDAAWREQKLVHQDIKPDNIMLDSNGFAKLADLGLARVASADQNEEVGDEVMGTPQYISPEQLTGIPTDVRSDIYSLGATFYQFVTGRFPYIADTAEDIAKMHVAGNLTPPKEINPEVPDVLNDIIVKMMARYPENRYQTPQPLMEALDIFLRTYDPNKKTTPQLKLDFEQKTPSSPASTLTIPDKGNENPASAAPAAPKPFDFGEIKPLAFNTPKPEAPAPQETPPSTESPAALNLGLNIPETKKAENPPNKEDSSNTPNDNKSAETDQKSKQKSKKNQPNIDKSKLIKKLKITGLVVGIFLIVIIAFGITFYCLAGANKLPEKIKPFGDKFRAFINGKVDEAQKEIAENAKRKELERQAEEKRRQEEEAAKPRQAYLDGIEAAFAALRSNPDNPEDFINLSEKLFEQFPAPKNDAERKAFNTLLPVYGRFDEISRIQPARNLAREKHEAEIEERRKADAQAQQERALANTKKQNQETAQDIREQEDKIQQQAAIDRQMVQERTARLKESLGSYYPAMVEGFNHMVFDNDPEPLKRAIQISKEVVIPSVSDSAEEKKLIAQMESFRRDLPKEAEKLRNIIAELGKINTNNFFSIQPGRDILDIVKVAPGVVQYRLPDGAIRDLKLNNPRIRQALFNRLNRRLKISNSEFYFMMMSKEYSQDLQKIAPQGFWQQCIAPFVNAATK